MKRKFRAFNKKIFPCLFVISLLSLSIVSFNAALAEPDNLPSQSRASNSDKSSNGKPQVVGGIGNIPGKNINVYILVIVPPSADKNEVVTKALANRGALPIVAEEKFTTTGVVWDRFGDASLSNDYVIQYYNPAGDPSSGAGLSALLNSHSTWNNVPYSNFAFQYGGITNRCPSLEPECNLGIFQFRDTFSDVAWVSLDEQYVLGVAYSIESDGSNPEESDVVMNTNLAPGFSWAADGIGDFDIETVFLHEFGHALGLGHEEKPTPAIMNPIYQGIMRNLLIDDINGVSSLYPCEGCPAPQFFSVYEDNMENGINGWTETGDTELWHQSINNANSPTTSWYYGQEGVFNYDTGVANSGSLTSPIISLEGATQAFLEFAEWSEVEDQKNFDHTRVQASNDGTNWTTVHFYKDASELWENRQVNLEAFAGNDLYIRFWFDSVDELENHFEGWYIDDVKILVDNTNTNPNSPPVLTSIGPQSVDEGTELSFTVTATDADPGDTLSYSIDAAAITAGATINSSTGAFSWTPAEGQASINITFTVTDDGVGTLSDSEIVAVTVNEIVEVHLEEITGEGTDKKRWTGTITIRAFGEDETGFFGTTVSGYWGDGTTDSCLTDSDGKCSVSAITKNASLTFNVEDISGGGGIFNSGLNHFGATSLTINRGETGTGPNNPPTADAGVDQSVTEGDLVGLDGSDSSDIEGTITYLWNQNSGIGVTLDDYTSATPSFPAPAVTSPEDLIFLLEVTDEDGATDSDTVSITVNPIGSIIPVHVLSIDMESIDANGPFWEATATITVHEFSGGIHGDVQSGVTVNGVWSGSMNDSVSCVTNASGECSVTDKTKDNGNAVFTITGLSGAGFSHVGSDHETSDLIGPPP